MGVLSKGEEHELLYRALGNSKDVFPFLWEMLHRAMQPRENPIRSAGKDCTGCAIGSPYTASARPVPDPDMADRKWREFSVT